MIVRSHGLEAALVVLPMDLQALTSDLSPGAKWIGLHRAPPQLNSDSLSESLRRALDLPPFLDPWESLRICGEMLVIDVETGFGYRFELTAAGLWLTTKNRPREDISEKSAAFLLS